MNSLFKPKWFENEILSPRPFHHRGLVQPPPWDPAWPPQPEAEDAPRILYPTWATPRQVLARNLPSSLSRCSGARALGGSYPPNPGGKSLGCCISSCPTNTSRLEGSGDTFPGGLQGVGKTPLAAITIFASCGQTTRFQLIFDPIPMETSQLLH